MEDHDFEIYNCAYGLVNRLQPATYTERSFLETSLRECSPYYFSHPPLLSFYGGYSLLMSEGIMDYKIYDDAALVFKNSRINRPLDELKKIYKTLAKVCNRYYSHNARLLEIRTPALFFSTLLCLVLFYTIFLFSGSKLLGVLGTLLYFSFYEVFARSLFGGYAAVDNLITVYFIYQYIFLKRGISVLTNGIYMALIDHKLITIPISSFVSGLFTNNNGEAIFIKRFAQAASRSKEIIIGFLIGTIIFWLWGITLNREAFMNQHVREHLFGRVFYGLLDLFGSKRAQVSICDLWMDFYGGVGPLFPVLFIWVLFDFIKNRFQGQKGKLFLLIQLIIGAISFSVVDNRQTKHLMLIMPAMVIFVMMFVAELKKPTKIIAYCLLLGTIIWNLKMIPGFLSNFSLFEPLNGW